MPRFELQLPDGTFFGCHTSDPETAARWLGEHAKLCVSANMAYAECRLRVIPMFVAGPDNRWDQPDWPVSGMGYNHEEYRGNLEKMQRLQKLLEEAFA